MLSVGFVMVDFESLVACFPLTAASIEASCGFAPAFGAPLESTSLALYNSPCLTPPDLLKN